MIDCKPDWISKWPTFFFLSRPYFYSLSSLFGYMKVLYTYPSEILSGNLKFVTYLGQV